MRPPDKRIGPDRDPGRDQPPQTTTASVTDASDSASPLRAALDQVIVEQGGSLKDLTVLAAQNDPFRIDTPARHRDGQWLAITARELGLGDRRIHLRGLHYMVLGRTKPDSSQYANTEEDWLWLQGDAGKAARWLGYIPAEQIIDQRNAEPEVRIFEEPRPRPYISVGVQVDIPDADNIEPYVGAYYVQEGKAVGGFGGVQPYHLVMIGEKSSLGDVLAPVAASYKADVYLPTGEPSDTMLHRMASAAADDGRPMVVLYFSDADPAGWQMPISVARKLQALKVLLSGMPDFEVRRVALTPDQVREHGLPSTPLKESEKRADKWRAAMGIEQTEIDALASLRPDLLRRIAREALDPFFDASLDGRVRRAYGEWRQEAQSVVDASMDAEHLEQLRLEAAEKLAELRTEIDAINDALRIDVDDFDLPPIAVPEAQVSESNGLPLLDSRWPFVSQCRALIASKAYENGDGS
jgi:hypothetical protein